MTDAEATPEDHIVLEFDPERRRHPLEKAPMERECQHRAVVLDDEARMVICKTCKKALDPYWYLELLAQEWKARAYHDNIARQAYAALEQQRRDAMARGRLFACPTEGAGARAWATFTAYFGREPFSVYRRGNVWYAAEEDGTHISEDYAAMMTRSRERKEMEKDIG